MLPTAYLHHGDNLAYLRTLPDDSVHSVVTDPPYGLGKEPDAIAMLVAWMTTGHYEVKGKGFMNKEWDAFVPQPALWRECLRVLRPGGHLLSFGGTRTSDLVTLGLRIAGFEIRDQLQWIYGSGFPKSLDISKAIDKASGANREVIGANPNARDSVSSYKDDGRASMNAMNRADITAPATPAAQAWQGWGTALKPAYEPIIMARKPLAGNVASNVIVWGTGGLNIDGCRVEYEDTQDPATNPLYRSQNGYKTATGSDANGASFSVKRNGGEVTANPLGRWPANILHDGSQEVLDLFPDAPGQQADSIGTAFTGVCYGTMERKTGREGQASAEAANAGEVGFKMKPGARRGDSGSAARFFYCPKTSKRDRDEGCEALPDREWRDEGAAQPERKKRPFKPSKNNHPTVKPTELMRYLVRLVTPKGGTVLDPFAGSGSTGKAAILEGFDFLGAELDAEYITIAEARVAWALKQRNKHIATTTTQ